MREHPRPVSAGRPRRDHGPQARRRRRQVSTPQRDHRHGRDFTTPVSSPCSTSTTATWASRRHGRLWRRGRAGVSVLQQLLLAERQRRVRSGPRLGHRQRLPQRHGDTPATRRKSATTSRQPPAPGPTGRWRMSAISSTSTSPSTGSSSSIPTIPTTTTPTATWSIPITATRSPTSCGWARAGWIWMCIPSMVTSSCATGRRMALAAPRPIQYYNAIKEEIAHWLDDAANRDEILIVSLEDSATSVPQLIDPLRSRRTTGSTSPATSTPCCAIARRAAAPPTRRGGPPGASCWPAANA